MRPDAVADHNGEGTMPQAAGTLRLHANLQFYRFRKRRVNARLRDGLYLVAVAMHHNNLMDEAILSMAMKNSLAAVLALALAAPIAGNAAAQSPLPAVGELPVPTPRPDAGGTDATTTSTIRPASVVNASSINTAPKIAPVRGSLEEGLDALTTKDARRALAIRAGMAPGSLDRKILAWTIALSGQEDIPSGEIAAISRDLPDWPGHAAMRRHGEEAMARENPPAQTVISAFGNSRPESVEGAILLARAHLSRGNKKAANAAIAPIWHGERLSKAEERDILNQVGTVLSREDHRIRMHAMFYRGYEDEGLRMGGLAEQASLARARHAVNERSKDAASKIKAVEPSSQRDIGYTFARIRQARITDEYREAARLLLASPRDPSVLINGDAWWEERKRVARGLLDEGDARTAYRLVSEHSAQSATDRVEAEFHSGWIALRFLNDAARARTHFEKIIQISSTPISLSRGHYWLARASSGPAATEHYRKAARHAGSFYGQLAAQHLGQRQLALSNPRPSAGEWSRFASRELVQAIIKLEEAGYDWRAKVIYRHLAETLQSAGELAILAARAEKRGDNTLALQVGKIAHSRGLDVDTVSWPIGAIPANSKIGKTGTALAYSIARQESAFNVAAVSHANARGLLQLLPDTAKMMAKKTGQKYSYKRLTTDASYNASLGAAYLSEQLDNFGNSYILTFVGYNAGPGRSRNWVEKYGDPRGKPIHEVVDWVERIPFNETRNYVQRVMENYQIYKTRLAGGRLDIEGDLRFGRR